MRSRGATVNKITINIPRLNDNSYDFDMLFSFWRQINRIEEPEVFFSFEKCDFLQQNAVAFIGGLVRLIQYKGGSAYFHRKTIRERVRTNLEQNGFLHALGFSGPAWDGNSIPYREDSIYDHNGFAEYLSDRWLGRGWVRISDILKTHITQPVIEAYINVFDHAESPIGVITCGQRYPSLGKLKLAIVDFGVGIPHTVRSYLKKPDMASADALRWAFQPGTTTKEGTSRARGVGLKYLKSFIEENEGKLEIYSDNGYACIASGSESFSVRSIGFEGTLIQITLRSNARYYRLPVEQDYDSSELLF